MTEFRQGTADRADVTMRLARAFNIDTSALTARRGAEIGSEKAMLAIFSIVSGIVSEYLDDGDQMVEATCICQISPGDHRILNPVCPNHGIGS